MLSLISNRSTRLSSRCRPGETGREERGAGWVRYRRPLVNTLVACLLTAGCDPTPDSQGKAAENFPSTPLIQSASSDAGHYAIDLFTAPEQPPSAGIIAVQLRVTATAQQSLSEDLDVSIAPIMPSMGHGTSEVAPAELKGSGRYVFASVDLFMPGRWDLVTQISGTEDDTITLPIDVR